MKSLLKILAVVCIALLTAQCVDSDLLNDPNNPSPSQVDADFLFNNIQLEARNVYSGISDEAGELSRMTYMFGATYDDAFSPQTFNGAYTNAYADLFIDVENLLPIAEEKELYTHSGAAKVLKAYAMIALVDVFGDVPMSQALDQSNFNPGADGGQAVYDSALVLLDDAIADLNKDAVRAPDSDLFYGGQNDPAAAWLKAANTLKLKAYLNTDNASAIQAMLNNGAELIDDHGAGARGDYGESLVFRYGSQATNPDSRHPFFANNYESGASDYMAMNYMNILLNDKSDPDPRIRYYMYRQTTENPTDVNLKTCINAFKPSHFASDDPFCLFDGSDATGDHPGYWGRDHLIAEGIPPDSDLRTTYGVYPAAGSFDDGQGEAVSDANASAPEDLGGDGIRPMLMSSYTHFMLAEYEMRLNNNPGLAQGHLETAIQQSFETVRASAGALDDGAGAEMEDSDIQDYISEVQSAYSGNELRTIAKEYYLALWPNGVEAYNLIRRTGFGDLNSPDSFQPAFSPSPGNWYTSFLYPANMVERNETVSQKSRTENVFWDGGNYNFDF